MSSSDKHSAHKFSKNFARQVGLLEPYREMRDRYLKMRDRQRIGNFLKKLDHKAASAELTAIVLTGDRNYFFEKVQASVESQNLKACRVEIVRNLMPTSLACQQALDRVTTRYFIIIDGDMVLRPTCFERLYFTITSDSNCTMATGELSDPIKGKIDGIHIYKTEAVRPIGCHPFTMDSSYEEYLKRRLLEEGHLWLHCGKNLLVGDHHPEWLPQELYWKHHFLAECMRDYKSEDPDKPNSEKDEKRNFGSIEFEYKIRKWIDRQESSWLTSVQSVWCNREATQKGDHVIPLGVC